MHEHSQEQSVLQLSDTQVKQRVEALHTKASNDSGFFARYCQVFTIEFYRDYFDVTTELVAKRALNSFNPFAGNFFDIGAGIPDLYGPFWILNTLIFSITMGANLSQYLQQPAGSKFSYDFSIVPLATGLLYLKTVIIPLIYRAALKCYSQDRLTYLHCLFIYGYSATVMIPVSLLNCIPNPAVQWMLLIYVIFAQTSFLTSNFSSELRYLATEKKYIVVTLVAVVQIALMVTYKFYFFKTQNYEQLGLIQSKAPGESNQFIQHLNNHF